MPRFTTKRYEQILAQMLAKVVSRTRLSDVADSGTLKHVLAATARQLDELYYQMGLLLQMFDINKATGADLDARAAEIQPAIISRNQATKASGLAVMSRPGTTGTISISAGTKVKTGSGVTFTTTAPGSITPTSPEQISGHGVGRDSGLIPVVADLPGSSGRVVAGVINGFVSKPTGVNEVTNPAAISVGGQDLETDDSFRDRLRQYILSLPRCTVQAIEAGVLGGYVAATGSTILFAKVVEDPAVRGYVTLYVDDGTGAAESSTDVVGENVCEGLSGPPPDSAVGRETVLFLDNFPVKAATGYALTSSTRGALTNGTDYILNPCSGQIDFLAALATSEVITANYTYYTGLIALAQKIVDGDPADPTNYPGLRAAGVMVTAQVPQTIIQNVEAFLTIQEGYADSSVIAAVVAAIENYINSLGISGDLIYNELVTRIMSVPGVYDVIVTIPAATDVTVLDDQLLRITPANISVS